MVPEIEEESCEPSQVTLLIPTLSLATTENVTVSDCDEVDNSTLELLAVIFPTVGFWSSVLDILIVTLSVDVLPAESATVNVKLSVDEPKL